MSSPDFAVSLYVLFVLLQPFLFLELAGPLFWTIRVAVAAAAVATLLLLFFRPWQTKGQRRCSD